jgi:peptide/nickel transport system ATP-binding protein
VDYLSETGTVHAVSEVSLTLRRGEILGLAGESGSGKSTLVYGLARLLRPPALITSGTVTYYPRSPVAGPAGPTGGVAASNGAHATTGQPVSGSDSAVDLLALSAAELRAFRWNDLAIVFQSAMNALNPVMTVGTQITDVLRAHRPSMRRRARHARAVELLRLVGIAPDRLNSYPHELSGGMRQRAGIAIALALAPEIIVMDEPTTALDVVVQREILTEIQRLQRQLDFAVIFITHDLSLLLELADGVAIMYAGRIVEQATRQELYAQPSHPYSYGLVNAFPSLHGPRRATIGIPGAPPDLRAVPPGCAFHPRCPLAFAPCRTVEPQLRPITPGSSRQVACHLYDSRYVAQPSATADLAAAYERLVVGSLP